MRNLLTFLFLIFFVSCIYAQERHLIFTGVVKNQKGKEIENAHIYSIKSGKGVISDQAGFFQLPVSKTETELIISHVSYIEQGVRINNKKELSDSIYLEIVLEVNPNYLSSVDIVENKRWQVVKPDRIWVYDYELLGKDDMLLLLKDTAKYELRLIDRNSKVVDNVRFKKSKPNHLIHDGLKNVFLDQKDSLFQIHLNNSKLCFYEGIHKKDFDLMIKPVVAGNDEFIFF